jgi:hypothetical protein
MKFSLELLTAAMLFLSTAALGQDPIFEDETNARLGADSQMGVRADSGDVDGDGDMDIIVANGQHSAPPAIPLQDVMLQINDGSGFFTDGAASRLPPSAFGQQLANAVVLGDVDGDTDLDAYVANGSSGGVLCPSTGSQNLLWLNDGGGNYSDATGLLPGYLDCSFDAAFGDIDGDGDQDIVVANVGYGGLGEVNRVLINDLDNSGVFIDGTYTALTAWPSDITYTVALGDLDGDNDLDMVVGNAPSSIPLNRFLRNDGGVFTDVTVSWTGFPPTDWPRPVWDVKLADMNGDGSLDILMSDALDGQRMILMLNQGGWLFTAQTIYVFYQYGLDVADVDSDGDVDILVSRTAPEGFPLSLLLNSGTSSPTFANVSFAQLPEYLFWDTAYALFRFPKFVDVNTDGAPDIYLPTLVWWWVGAAEEDYQDRLFINTLVPELGEVEVAIDIKFCSNPNAFNCKKKGVLPVTIFGTGAFDVADIDISTLRLCKEDLSVCTGAPSDYSIADRGDPSSDLGAAQCALLEVDEGVFEEQDYLTIDGFLDFDAAFEASEVQAMLGTFCGEAVNAVSEALVITGSTLAGTPLYSVPVGDTGTDQLVKKNR